MAGIESALAAHPVIGLDTAIFIYHFEANPTYLPLTTVILNRVQAGEHLAVTSVIALIEINVHPWRLNQPHIAQTYEALLVNFPHLQILDVSRETARLAAQIRAGYNLRPADALHIASALVGGATLWVSNDKQHRRIADLLPVLTLEDYAG